MSREQSFGQFVKERRRTLDLTQEELARRVGCAAITIRKIEADSLRPSQQIAERLAMALAIPLDDRAEFVRRAREVRPEPAPAPTPAPAPEEIGREDLSGRAIRGYALAERIGTGGMGAVYRAVQPNVEREVAVKIILPAYANHPDFIRRFEAEAQLVARLEHPHIVPLYDYWREPGVAYLVMRLLRGGSVQALVQNGPLTLETTARLLEQICSALHVAHRIGVIHRDLKPGNVLLDEDSNAYLADFGIAKNLGNPNLEDQTQVDMMIGSPHYMSPEQIRSLTVRPQTDIYCLGVMLYEMLTGALPFVGPTPFDLIQQHIGAPLPPLAAHRTGLPAALDAVIARAAAKDPDDRYPDVMGLLDDFRRALDGGALVYTRPISAAEVEEEFSAEIVNPYKGLRAFGEADAEDFFGRETLVQQLLARLGEGGDLSRFLAVVGPSGSGKSSVVGAGLVPALRRGGLPGSDNWFIVDCLPGPHPFEELEAALLRVAVNPPASLLAQLKDDDRGLLRAVRRCLPDDESVELVLVIDQFEEVFTLVQDEAERALLLSSLVMAVLDGRSRVRVVITLRADFTDRPLRYVDFGELIHKRSEFVLPLTPDELERAVLGPARRVGLKLEAGLTSAIPRDVGDQPGTLPLLQYALTELFDKREGHMLTKSAYAEIGGVLGALGRRAEEVYVGLDGAGQVLTRQLFLRLVTLGEGVEDTRRRVLRAELEGLTTKTTKEVTKDTRKENLSVLRVLSGLIEAFGKHRLLTFDRDPVTRGPTVEVAHEALLREWPRLREWLSESRADVRLQRQLANAAAEWHNAKQDASFLLTGARLAQFEGWAASTTVALTQDERTFLDASIAERDRREAEDAERQRRKLEAARKLAETERARAESEKQRAEEQVHYVSRVRLRNRVIAAAGAVALVLAMLAGLFGLQSNQNATRAEQNLSTAQIANTQEAAQRATAEAASVLAFANAATAQFNEQNRATQQAIAEVERDRAEAEKHLATSRELALASLNNLDVDPERSVLLALHGLSQAHTKEAEEALHRAVQALRVQFTLRGHTEPVGGVAYSPDGRRLATGSDDGSVKIWDTATGEELLTLKVAPEGWVEVVAFSPDGAQLAVGIVNDENEQGHIRIWDVKTWQEVLNFSGYGVVFSPDGARLAAASDDGAIKVLDAASGKEMFTLSGHTEWIGGIAFSPDGTRLATASGDRTIKIWDAATGRELLTLSDEAEVYDVAFSPDGRRFATVNREGVAKVRDAASGQVLLTLTGHTNLTFSVAYSPDGTQLATASADHTIKVWDAASGRELLTLGGHTDFVFNLAFSPAERGAHLASVSVDGTAKIWDVSPAGSRELLTIVGARFRNIDFSPDEKKIVTASFSGVAQVWDTTTGEELLTLSGHVDRVYSAVYSPDGRRIATSSADNTVRVWDAASGQELFTLTGHGDGVVGGGFPGVLEVVFSPDGQRLATAGADGIAKVWDSTTGEELLTLSGHTSGLSRVLFSPNGSLLVTTSDEPDSTARIWDAVTGKPLHVLMGHPGRIWGVAFSPDGSRIATAGRGGVVKMWDVATGQDLMTFVGHTSTVAGVAFSPDGQRLATAGSDSTIRIWDVATGEEILALPGQTSSIWAVAFMADGSRLISISLDGTARIMVVRLDDLIALAKSRVTRSLTTEECQKYLHVDECP